MATPLKINTGDGSELKEFTSSEENYIAYQIGLHLASGDTTDEAALNKVSGTLIGSYANTFFNEPVGTHPSTSITTGTTTTNVYQDSGTAAESDSDVQIPIRWVDNGGQIGFKQMPDSDLNIAVDRYLSTIFTNDYPGVFKLGTASPGVDYSVHISNVFTDTQTDGTSVVYNIYRKSSGTSPSAIQPLFVRDNGGFDGIQAMSDRQIKYSFGQRAKTRITASKIGTYQLRSSSQGAPTDPGTWISAGTATDTKKTTADQSFTSPFTAYYATNYTRAYTKAYTGNYVNAYSTAYSNFFESITYTRAYAAAYTRSYTGPYSKAYTGAFETPYTVSFQSAYVRQQAETYIGSYQSTYNRTTYTGPTYNLNRTYQSNYVRNINYVGPGLEGYQRNFNRGYARNFARLVSYTRSTPLFFVAQDIIFLKENYEGSGGVIYNRSFPRITGPVGSNTYYAHFPRIGRMIGPMYIGPSGGGTSATGFYSRNWFDAGGVQGIYTGQPNLGNWFPLGQMRYIGEYGAGYFGGRVNRIGTYQRVYTGPTGSGTTQYINERGSDYYLGTPQNFAGPLRFGQYYIMLTAATSPLGVRLGNAGGGLAGSSFGESLANEGPFYTGNTPWPLGYGGQTLLPYRGAGMEEPSISDGVFYVRTIDGAGYSVTFTGAQIDYYQRNLTYVRNYTRAYTSNYVGISGAYIRNYNIAPQYVRNFALNVNYVSNYEGNVNFQGPIYERNFVGNYTSNYVRNYTSVYVGTYNRIFSRAYSRAFNTAYVTDYVAGYVGTYDSVFSGIYTTDYVTDYITDYLNSYETEYATVYTGNFEGLTIQSASETNETYTLYVRIG